MKMFTCKVAAYRTGFLELNMLQNWSDSMLTHWGRVTHIRVGNPTIIGPDNGLSPCRRQAIIWTNAGILLIGPRGTNFSEIIIGIETFSFKKMHLKMSSAKWRPFCLGLNVLINQMFWLYFRGGAPVGWSVHNIPLLHVSTARTTLFLPSVRTLGMLWTVRPGSSAVSALQHADRFSEERDL